MTYLRFIAVHIVHDSLVVLGAMGNRSVQGVMITNFHLLHFLDHSLQELIMDTPLHEQMTYRNIQCHDDIYQYTLDDTTVLNLIATTHGKRIKF